MVCIGVDPALVTTGVAVIASESDSSLKVLTTGEIETSSRDPLPDRLLKIYSETKDFIQRYHPAVMVLEKLYSHHRHPQTVSLLGHARGVICLAAAEAGLDLREYAATRVCKAVLGRGQASSEQMRLMVERMLNLKGPVKSEHIIDALALTIAYIHNRRWEESPVMRR